MTRTARLIAAIALAQLASGCAATLDRSQPVRPVTVGIAAINDFHGALVPPRTSIVAPGADGQSVPVPAGGAAWLASAVDNIRSRYPHHITVAAGDLIGASQLASSIYLDEPAIGVLNRTGLDLAAVGNHEFDLGRAELLRKQNGGCARHAARQPCQIERFSGARFRYLAASTHDEHGRPLLPGTAIRSFGTGRQRVRIGFVGLTLTGTPQLVSGSGVKGLRFADEAATINDAIPALKRGGADAIVVLIHEGARTGGAPDPNGCAALSGALLPILERLSAGVDVVISGHTHAAYVCDWKSADGSRSILLTSAGQYGQLVSDIALTIDPATRRVTARRASNVIVQSAGYDSPARGPVQPTDAFPRFTPRADIAAYVRQYTDASEVYARRPIGRLTGPAARADGSGAQASSPLAGLIADAQLAATAGAGAQIALTNPFGIRAALKPAADGTVTYGDIYTAQPFANMLVTQTMTGADLKAALEQGLDGSGADQLLSPSAGFRIAVDMARPAGDRITALTLGGVRVDPAADYRVTTNSFLADGGDGFTGFTHRRDAVIGMADLDALEAWIAAVRVRAVPMEERTIITRP